MIGRIRSHWENITDSLWFVPGWCILLLVGFAFFMPEMDTRFDARFVFPGDANAARAILQVVAGSLITVISLVFSITILVLQQASQQYTPRLIGNFMSFRGVQIVLGFFLGTFLYALLILRYIREQADGSPEYVPDLSVTAAIALAAICIVLLVYFIHHTAVSLEVPAVTRRIAAQIHDSLKLHYPASGQPIKGEDSLEAFRARHAGSVPVEIRAVDSGFVRRVDEDQILDALESAGWLAVCVQVGSYVHYGGLLMEVGGTAGLDAKRVDDLREAIALDLERSLHQDPLFGIRQLVDIALRALSPSVNDPTTAEYALSELGDLLIALGRRPYVSRARTIQLHGDGTLEVWAARAMYSDFVHASFAQIRRMARDKLHVTLHLLSVVEAVGRNLSEPRRLQALRREVGEILDALDRSDLDPTDRESVRERAEQVLAGMASAYDRVEAGTPETHEHQ